VSTNLVYADNDEEVKLSPIPSIADKGVITGNTVCSMYHLKDSNDHEGGYFIFPNICVRIPGTFRLRFSLFEIVGYVFLLLFFS